MIVFGQLDFHPVSRAHADTGEQLPPVEDVPGAFALELVEDRLRRRLQTDVSITITGADKGMIKLGFYSPDDLERLLDVMLGPDRSDFD